MKRVKKEKIESPYHNRLNMTKVIVLMEIRPQSDLFTQIMLNEDQYRAMLDSLEANFVHTSPLEFRVICNDRMPIHLAEIQESYSQEEIDKHDH